MFYLNYKYTAQTNINLSCYQFQYVISNKWWCFDDYSGCQNCDHYTQDLITPEDYSHTNDNTIQSVKIYRTPIPPPPSFESKSSSHSNQIGMY